MIFFVFFWKIILRCIYLICFFILGYNRNFFCFIFVFIWCRRYFCFIFVIEQYHRWVIKFVFVCFIFDVDFIFIDQIHAVSQRLQIFSFIIFWFVVESFYQILNYFDFVILSMTFIDDFFYFVGFFKFCVVFYRDRIEIIQSIFLIWIVVVNWFLLCYWYHKMHASFRW